jgi:hypothetical protein
VTHDHVLLEALQRIHFTKGRCVGQDAGRLLERCRRNETLSLDRCLGDAQEDRFRLSGLATGFDDPIIFVPEIRSLDLLTPESLGITRIGDPDLAKHLTNDRFDVLIIDGHTLQAINLLDFGNQEVVKSVRPQDVEDFMWIS